jgi:hypothetical protein
MFKFKNPFGKIASAIAAAFKSNGGKVPPSMFPPPDPQEFAGPNLKETLCDARGKRYTCDAKGTMRGVEPKPWGNKAEMKRYRRERQARLAYAEFIE